ncbi:MAG: hypothetical protein C4526_06780 [Nitrospiraceae bacterium]|nr:MAG: hypothetical protein C4526_06780 [Nitrospiraceae bacterium]
MKQLFQFAMIATLLTLGLGVATAQEKPLVVVTAFMSNAGPYGESWVLTMTPEGRVSLTVLYMGNPGGSLMARFDLNDAAIEAIRKAATSEHFFELPPKLEPKVLAIHKPALQLDVRVGSTHHNVNLYDPAQLGKDTAVERFLKVWNAVFAAIPLKPAW